MNAEIDLLARLLAMSLTEHQRRMANGHCWCGKWPGGKRDETWMDHVAAAQVERVRAVLPLGIEFPHPATSPE